MEIELIYGWQEALISSGVIGILFTWYFISSSLNDFFDPDDIVINIAVLITAFVNSFCTIFPLLNLGLNYFQLAPISFLDFGSLITNEFSNGIIALRITSVIIGFHSFYSIWKTVNHPYYISQKEEVLKVFDFPEFEEQLDIPIDLKPFRNRLAHFFLNIAQYGVFQLGVMVLWLSNILGIQNVYTVVLAWVIFYFVDDWRIIFSYSLSLKGRIMKSHSRQIWVTNIVIIVLSAICVYMIHWGVLIVFLLLAYFNFRLWVLLKEGYEGFLTIITPLSWKWFNEQYDHITGEKIVNEKSEKLLKTPINKGSITKASPTKDDD